MDEAGNMVMGYNVSGGVYPSLRIGGRLAGDAPGTMTEELTLAAGSGSQTGFVFWGDYSQTTLDPVDDCTFWHVGAFQPVTSAQQSWATQIGAVRFPRCVADLAVTKSRSPSGDVAAGTNVTYTVTVTDNGPASAAHVTLTDDVPAGAGFVSVSAPPDWTCTVPAEGTAGTISCEKDSMANGETATFTVVATVNCDVPNGTTIGNTASPSAVSPPDNDSSNDSTSASFVVFNPAPVVSASVSTAVLKQNDQNLVNVGLAAMATDGACPAPTTFTVQVFSNESDQGPNGENHFSPDAKDMGSVPCDCAGSAWAPATDACTSSSGKATDMAETTTPP